jgi:hypothetical protein
MFCFLETVFSFKVGDHRCDELNLNGTHRPSNEVCATYGTAQKMCASMTYAFGHVHGLGSMYWQPSQVDGSMMGNPSVSEMVSRYMLSLHRRKVKAGETATSARAISAVRCPLWQEGCTLGADVLMHDTGNPEKAV